MYTEVGTDNIITNDIKDVIETLPPITQKEYKPPTKSADELIAILNGADQHCEEAVNPKETLGLYSYNWDVYLAREWMTTQKCIEFTNLLRNTWKINKLIIEEHGDYVSN